jgi:copper resistance protein D
VDDPLIYVRALHFAATVTVAGVAFFIVFIAEPAFCKTEAGTNLPGILRRRLAWLASIGLLLTVLSGAAWLVLVAGSMSDQPVADVISEDVLWTVLSETDFGRGWLARFVLACFLAALFIPFMSAKTSPSVWIKSVVVLLAAGLVGTLAWAGHALGASGIEGIVHPAADVLHLVAAAAWVGALLPLALVLAAVARDAGSLASAAAMTARFSTLGIIGVGTLLVTGTINTWYLAGSIPALTSTDYGRLLIIKVALFLGMVVIAAVNRLRLTPRLAAAASPRAMQAALRQLRRNVAVEIAAGAIILAIVAVLGVTPPGIDEQIMPHAHHHSNWRTPAGGRCSAHRAMRRRRLRRSRRDRARAPRRK